MPRLVFDDEAMREIRDARGYFDEQRQGLGDEFAMAVAEQIDQILAYPQSGSPWTTHTRRSLIRRFHYWIVYDFQNDVVAILIVAHTSRSDDFWRDRLPDLDGDE